MMSFEFTIWPIGSFEWCLDSKDYHSLQEQHDLYIRTHVLVETVEKAERKPHFEEFLISVGEILRAHNARVPEP